MRQNGLAARAMRKTKNVGKAVGGMIMPLTRSFAIAAGTGVALHIGLNAIADATALSSIFAKSGTYVGAATALGVALAKESGLNSPSIEKASLKRVGINAALATACALTLATIVQGGAGLGVMTMLSFAVGQAVAYGYNKNASNRAFSSKSSAKAKTPQDKTDRSAQLGDAPRPSGLFSQLANKVSSRLPQAAQEQDNAKPTAVRPPRINRTR